MNECGTCIQDKRIDALEKDSERNSSQHREFYNKFSEQKTESAVSSERYNSILISLRKLEKTVDELASKPGKRWDGLIQTAVTGLATGIIGYMIGMIF